MMTPEQLYDIHCETVGGGKMGHVHWDDLPLETRIQWGRFAARMADGAKVTEERLKWLEYRNDVLKSAWCIIAGGIKAVDPDADPEYDTNNFYGYIQAGVEAQKKVADGEKAIAAFLAERVGAAFQTFDEVIDLNQAAVMAERERCAKVVDADEYDCRRDDPTTWSKSVAAKIRSGQ